jgi:hypothetical protein
VNRRAPRGALAVFLVLAVACTAASAALARPATIRFGVGTERWKLATAGYVRGAGLVGSRRFKLNEQHGCPQGPGTASIVDTYRDGQRVSWRAVGDDPRLHIIDVATTRKGDRTGEGFAVGTSTIADVRRRHPTAAVLHPIGVLALGRTLVSITRVTGYNSWIDLGYWFDRRGRLVALEVDAGGCPLSLTSGP